MRSKGGRKGCNLSRYEIVYRWRVKDRERLMSPMSKKKKSTTKLQVDFKTFQVKLQYSRYT